MTESLGHGQPTCMATHRAGFIHIPRRSHCQRLGEDHRTHDRCTTAALLVDEGWQTVWRVCLQPALHVGVEQSYLGSGQSGCAAHSANGANAMADDRGSLGASIHGWWAMVVR